MGLVEFLSRKRNAFLVFFILAFLFLLPIFRNISFWGFYDWDQHLFYHGSARISILKFGQFPFWNPFYCGGNPLLANPQSGFLSPFFLLVLAFGEVVGLKLQALAYLILGLFGMFLLARRMGIKVVAAYFAAVVFMLSSWFAARILVGHTTFFPFALVPWAFLFYLMAQDDSRFSILSALVLAVMFLSGGVYPFYFTALLLGLHAVLDAVELQRFRSLLIVFAILALAMLFSAVKLLPVLEFTSGLRNPDTQFGSVGLAVRGLLYWNQGLDLNDAFTGRAAIRDVESLETAAFSGSVAWGWHEYSYYIGIMAFVLSLAAVLIYRRVWKLLIIALFFLLLGLGEFSPIPLWGVFKGIPVLGALHGPSRLLIMFVFCCALLSGRVLSDVKPLNGSHVALVIVLVVLTELFLVSRPLLYDAFPNEPYEINTYEFRDYVQLYSVNRYLSQYPNMLQNLATVNCYERVHLRTAASAQFFDDGEPVPNFIGNAYLAETNASFNLSYFSPNRVDVQVNGSGTLVYNQNYFRGWHSTAVLSPYKGLVAAQVSGPGSVSFYYVPTAFYIGLAISLVALAGAAFWASRARG